MKLPSNSCLAAVFSILYLILMGSYMMVFHSECRFDLSADAVWNDWMSVAATVTSTANDAAYPQSEAFQNAWYIDDKPESLRRFEKTYANRFRHLLKDPNFVPYSPPKSGPSEIIGLGDDPVLTALRPLNRSTYNFFHPVCHQYRFNTSLFPTVSIIMPIQNERPGLLSLTVHSILARTPPSLLKEIIISDDNVDERHEVNRDEIEHLVSLSPKIRYVSHDHPLGCAGSRLEAAKLATGDVLVVVDSHVEMYSNDWLQHLLLPILENPGTLSMQALDILDDLPGHKRKGSGAHHYGVISDVFVFGYVGERFGRPKQGVEAESPSSRLPYASPFVPGSLFAIRRDEFWRLGGYDKGLAVWGGENTELVIKIWSCGFNRGKGILPGRAVVVPCSRVGHVYRIHMKETGRWPPDLPNATVQGLGLRRPGKWELVGGGFVNDFERIVIKNNIRILYVWGNEDTMRGYLSVKFGVNSTDPKDLPAEWRPFLSDLPNDPHIQEQLRFQKKNQCRDFDWFDRHIYYKMLGIHHPWHPSQFKAVTCGSHRANSCGECPNGNGQGWCHGVCKWCPHGAIDDDLILEEEEVLLSETAQCVSKNLKCRAKTPLGPIKKQINGNENKEVRCGKHAAPTCALCPQGNGAPWCNADCHWCPHGAKDATILWNKRKDEMEVDERSACVRKGTPCRTSS